MSFSSIVAGIFAVAKAVPQVMALLKQISDKYIDERIASIDVELSTKEQQRTTLLKAIRDAKTDSDIINLSIILRKLQDS